ncbi:MAG: homoserine dehydrogenase [Puniceicoccaceae bacterium]
MFSKTSLGIGFLGLGTVGQGVWKHLLLNRPILEKRIGASIHLCRAAVRRLDAPREIEISRDQLTTDLLSVIQHPEIDIICEVMGGIQPALDLTLQALAAGKTVVSANKALLCDHGPEILAAAERGGGHYFFEASVAGGIPVIKALHEGFVANQFPEIYGILNGTSNYILTRMEREGLTFDQTLGEARRLGYVEADESLDLDGWDAAHKAVILAYLAHGIWIPTRQITVKGIREITTQDIEAASSLGYKIKLIARINRDLQSHLISISIEPTLIPLDSMMASVDDVYNGVSITGDVVGTTFLIGRGAGQDPTTSAVISDIVDAGWSIVRGVFGSGISPSNVTGSQCHLASPEQVFDSFYLRMEVDDRCGVLAEVARCLAQEGISVARLVQRAANASGQASLILLTHTASRASLQRALRVLEASPEIVGKIVSFPIFNP